MQQNKVLSLIGLAMRARKVVSGEFACENAVKDGSARLMIVATDASDNTKKLFHDKCSFYEVPILDYASKETLGHAIGKEMRASVAITDDGLAKQIVARWNEELGKTEE